MLLPRLLRVVLTTRIAAPEHAVIVGAAIDRLKRTAAAVSRSVSAAATAAAAAVTSSSVAPEFSARTDPVEVTWRQLKSREFTAAHRTPLGVSD